MSTDHTPGPWEFVPKITASENHRGFSVRAEKANKHGKWALAEVQPGDEDGTIGEANARLIAEAPNLLESLVAMLVIQSSDESKWDSADFVKARMTIARAIGAV